MLGSENVNEKFDFDISNGTNLYMGLLERTTFSFIHNVFIIEIK